MDKLLTYLNGLPKADRQAFVARCDTSEGYLRKAISKGQRLGESLCIAIDRESGGAVRCEDIRTDVDWAYLRNTASAAPAPAQEPGHA
ncbi:helix-turn-helix domain-containing protein [Delftia sp. BR1]|nr:helix-turn-helix domain-containing protein [Delftia sp. BR1]